MILQPNHDHALNSYAREGGRARQAYRKALRKYSKENILIRGKKKVIKNLTPLADSHFLICSYHGVEEGSATLKLLEVDGVSTE